MSGVVRLFVGAPLEADALGPASALAERVREACTAAAWKCSWVPTKNLHLTLKFLGDVAAARVPSVEAALGPIAARPAVPVQLGGLGAFPSVERPTVLWLGLTRGKDAVAALAAEVEARLAPLGFEAEKRAFHPHVTLARVKRPGSSLATVLAPFAPAEIGQSRVREIVLYRSVLGPDGSEYTAIRRVPLQA